jgi:hypothetical protein
LGRIALGGERSLYFRYTTTSTGQRDTLAVGAYDPKGRKSYLTLAAAREKAASWSKQYKDGARDLRQHFAKLEAGALASQRKRAPAGGKRQARSGHSWSWTCPVATDGLKVLDLLGIFNQIDLTVAVN